MLKLKHYQWIFGSFIGFVLSIVINAFIRIFPAIYYRKDIDIVGYDSFPSFTWQAAAIILAIPIGWFCGMIAITIAKHHRILSILLLSSFIIIDGIYTIIRHSIPLQMFIIQIICTLVGICICFTVKNEYQKNI